MTNADGHGHPEPPVAGDETATLLGSLERQRATLAWKCGGLDAAGLRAKLAPSSITLGGLLKHLASVEDTSATPTSSASRWTGSPAKIRRPDNTPHRAAHTARGMLTQPPNALCRATRAVRAVETLARPDACSAVAGAVGLAVNRPRVAGLHNGQAVRTENRSAVQRGNARQVSGRARSCEPAPARKAPRSPAAEPLPAPRGVWVRRREAGRRSAGCCGHRRLRR